MGVLAHVGGVPVEELAGALLPVWLTLLAALRASRGRLRRLRRGRRRGVGSRVRGTLHDEDSRAGR